MTNLEYKAFYRKYRPKNFSEVQSQEHIISTLTNIIKNDKVSHGYLFAGPRGTGKTSIAKIFAAMLNCQNYAQNENAYANCLIKAQNSMDIIEMDAASNNGVDEIRELKDNVQNLPFDAKYKIYIIDEVHMLTKSAFNAFLKLLESPPKHIVFILATTDPQKIPLTVLSRLQRFNFKKIEKKSIKEKLTEILTKENIACETQALNKIVKLAQGSLRDAISMLDQLATFTNNNITEQALFEIFGISALDNLLQILDLANNNQITPLLKLSNQLIAKGADIELLVKDLIAVLKDYIIFKKTYEVDLLTTVQLEDFKKLNISLSKAYKYLDILFKNLKEIRYSTIVQEIFELTLIELATQDKELLENKQYATLDQQVVSGSVQSQTTILTPKAKVEKNDEASIKSPSFDDVLFTPPVIEKDEFLEKMFSGNIDNNKTEENVKIDTDETNIDYDTAELEREFLDESEDDTTEIDPLPMPKIPDIDIPDIIPYRPVQETDPQKLFEINRVANNEMLKSVEIDRELRMLKEQELEADRLLEEGFYNNDNDGLIEYADELIAHDELILAKSITAEILLAKKQNKIFEGDLYKKGQILNLLSLSDKDALAKAKTQWERLKIFSSEQRYYNYIPYLEKCKLIASANNFILLSANENEYVWQVNSFVKDIEFQELIIKLTGKPTHIIAISKKFFKEMKETWKNLVVKPEAIPLAPLSNKTKTDLTESFMENLIGKKIGII
ncbi:DNA polymerase III subunit gamma/tau [Mycoplasma iguanae]|uniref:DNA polymerase III subunit gamma/tau n=1 Tax=Mycoplasma iguanae TaxID=292461 RepID=A0ABY5R9B8_9MOLU|nr:DNA polymerase III subunit gamma/tau [Mycoplasma iguanae]UVD81767.1 DNA polymerase III subunit gamma/tau [Mycoplasma iguanae]